MVEKEKDLKIKSIRSDRGGEFLSENFARWCKSEGIRRQLTTPYTPSQNGVVERKNRTIMEMARAMLAHASLPRSYWAEACNTAVYIQNRFPTRALQDMTPFQAYYGRKPTVSHFRVFGCSAFVHIPKEKRQKLDFKSRKLLFLGYSAESDAYRLYDPDTRTTTVSRDVVFDESFITSAEGAAAQPIPILPPPSLPDPPASPVITPSTSHPVPPIQPPYVSPDHALSDSDSDLDVADATPKVDSAPPRREKRVPGWLYSTVASSGVTKPAFTPPPDAEYCGHKPLRMLPAVAVKVNPGRDWFAGPAGTDATGTDVTGIEVTGTDVTGIDVSGGGTGSRGLATCIDASLDACHRTVLDRTHYLHVKERELQDMLACIRCCLQEFPLDVFLADMQRETDSLFKDLEISGETKVLLWSMRERHDPCSKFAPYFASLPDSFNTGLSFGVSALKALDGTTVFEELMQAKEHLRSEYEELFPALSYRCPNIFPQEKFTWDMFLWACELWYSNGLKIAYPDGTIKLCLVPFVGLLNHSLYPHVTHYSKVDPESKALILCSARPCIAGQQCFLSYGALSNSHLLMFYGFMLSEKNPFDVVPIDLDLSDSPDRLKIIQGLKLGLSHFIRGSWLKPFQIPSRLIATLCIAFMDEDEATALPLMLNYEKMSLDSKRKAYDFLLSLLSSMLDQLGDSLSAEDMDEYAWDIELATSFKHRQRKLLQSACDSALQF
ncbi:hypothetical protein L7F22_011502 [Adiantum nelumboides]|nr:hypothetical protein [Adiantum nelumboides]